MADPLHDHERTDVDVGVIAKFGAGLLVSTVAVVLLMAWLFGFLARQQPAASAEPSQAPAAPKLQVNPYGDLQSLRSREERTLSSYGWVDKNTGVVRVPIERAMELALEKSKRQKE